MRKLLQQAKEFEKLATQTDPFTGKELGRKLTDAELARAMRLNLEAELDAINLYTSHMEATDNEQAIEVLKHVIKEEKDHVALFLELIKTLDSEQEEILDGGEKYFNETVKK